ncbi:alpha/beta hydrolase [Bdellovibrio sp. 22V]|uniref:alpha/beta hydrolase n=1 Tax=Bdellovibrio TaxID=958 RepID=UPI002543745D|nr:alpha/beta hydrolase [Bdellovibrio sp. 22V]WII70808.1 alpha/beta hydrolase [Bdellovibrio sp. 22V]
MEYFISFVKIIIAVVLLLAAGIFFFQGRMIFFPETLPKDYSFEFKIPAEEKYTSLDGEVIHSLYFRAEKPKGVILYFHGNAGALDSWGELGEEFIKSTGWSLWMVDYPGYGKSTGSVGSEENLHKMASAVFMEVKKLEPQHKIVVLGRSMGSGLALRLASENPLAGVILETPYYSGTELAKTMFPWVPQLLVRYKFPSNEWAKEVSCPVLIVHGTEDEVIPLEHGKRLFELLPGKKRMTVIKGGHHNDLTEYEEYWQGIRDFLATL